MRSLSRDERSDRRILVIRLRESGHTYDEIAEITGLSRTGAFDICKRHVALGARALRDAPNGRKTGDGRILAPEQEMLARQLIAGQMPDDLNLSGLVWTPAAVSQLIQQRFDIQLPVRTLHTYLVRWGFTSQWSRRMNLKLIAAYPGIVARARSEDAEIHWGDEFRLGSDNGHPDASVICTVTNRSQFRWMIVPAQPDADDLIDFLRRLTQGATKKLFVIVDRFQAHCAEPVEVWLAEHTDAVQVYRVAVDSVALDSSSTLPHP